MMRISNVLFFCLFAILVVYLFLEDSFLENYVYPYLEVGGILFNNLFSIIMIITIIFFIIAIYKKIL